MKGLHYQGPVPLANDVYIQRQFESKLLSNVLASKWVLLLGPRQHGKTSAIIRLKAGLNASGVTSLVINLQEIGNHSNYRDLLLKVATTIASELGTTPTWPDSDNLYDWIARSLGEGATPVCVLIDEASAISEREYRELFFGQIRAISTRRAEAEATEPSARLRFVFTGTFRPESLVDDKNSPFNICERIETEDLSIEQVKALGSEIFSAAECERWGARIFAEVGGQPYLVQVLYSALAGLDDTAKEQAFADTVLKIEDGDDDHIPAIVRKIVAEQPLLRIVGEMINNTIPNDPTSADIKYLKILGLGQREGAQFVFRNPIYKRALSRSPQLRIDGTGGRLYGIDADVFNVVNDAKYREIAVSTYRGATEAYNLGHFRLSVAGFGACLEAILIDYLIQQPPGSLTPFFAGLTFQPPFEKTNDPQTWRLVNLVKVAQKLPKCSKLRDSAREYRNDIHPAVAFKNYSPQPQLEPDVRIVSGMVDALLRDLQ